MRVHFPIAEKIQSGLVCNGNGSRANGSPVKKSVPGKKIGILLKTFPKISETFILNEILGLEAGGLDLQIFSLRRPVEQVFHSSNQRVKAPVTYVPWHGNSQVFQMIKSHFILMMRNPLRYWGALWFLFHRSEPNRFQEFAQAGSLAAVVQFSGITHLHTHYANEPAGVAELVYHLTGIPFSISTHAKDIYLSSKESLRRKMSRSRFIVTCTEFNKRYLRSIATCKTPIVKVYHGLFTDKFKPERNDGNGGPPHEVPLILSVGRFRKKKGFPTLLQACRWLKDEGIDFRCKIVGFGPEKDSLDRWIETLSIGDKVQLEGKMVHEELIGLYRKADLFVLPCQVDEEGDRDGIPNVIMEAMAMEIPVISTTVSGIPELIDHEKTGILVPPKDPGALKSAMKHLLGQPTLRQNLGFAGRRRIVHYFDAKHHIEQLKALINHTLDPASAESITQEKRVKDYVH